MVISLEKLQLATCSRTKTRHYYYLRESVEMVHKLTNVYSLNITK